MGTPYHTASWVLNKPACVIKSFVLFCAMDNEIMFFLKDSFIVTIKLKLPKISFCGIHFRTKTFCGNGTGNVSKSIFHKNVYFGNCANTSKKSDIISSPNCSL